MRKGSKGGGRTSRRKDFSAGDESSDEQHEGGHEEEEYAGTQAPQLTRWRSLLPTAAAAAAFSAAPGLLSGSEAATTAVAALPALTLMGHAGLHGLKEYTSNRREANLSQKQAEQAEAINKDAKKHAEALHREAKRQAQDLAKEELHREAEQHMQDVTTQLRESQKEADRDLWEQQNNEKQSLMMVAALLLAGAFQLCVEGQLPPDPGGVLLLGALLSRPRLVDVYYAFLGAALSLLLVSILSAVYFTTRMSKYMLARTSKQQETLRMLRMIAYEQLESMYNEEDDETASAWHSEATLKKRLRQMRVDFSRRLWEQPVLVVDWNSINRGRHIVGFDEWYAYNCQTISNVAYFCFEVGAGCLMVAMGLYVEAHLLSGDEEAEVTSTLACRIFWAFILLAIFAIIYLRILGWARPAPKSVRGRKPPAVRDVQRVGDYVPARGPGRCGEAVRESVAEAGGASGGGGGGGDGGGGGSGSGSGGGRRGSGTPQQSRGGTPRTPVEAEGGDAMEDGGAARGGESIHRQSRLDPGDEVEVHGFCGGGLNRQKGVVVVEEDSPDAPTLARQNTDDSVHGANGEEGVLWYVVQMRKGGQCYRIKIDNLRKVPPHSINPVVAELERRRPELNNVNVFEMQTQSMELYKDLDVNNDENISMKEICGVLGFAPKEVPNPRPEFHPHPGERRPGSPRARSSGNKPRNPPSEVVEFTQGAEIEYNTEYNNSRHDGDWVPGKILAGSSQGPFNVEYVVLNDGGAVPAEKNDVPKRAIRASNIHRSVHSAHERLRKHPMLQEAVFELLERLVHKIPKFVALKAQNRYAAERYLRNQRAEAEKALKSIREKPEKSLLRATELMKQPQQRPQDGAVGRGPSASTDLSGGTPGGQQQGEDGGASRPQLRRQDTDPNDPQRSIEIEEWESIMRRIFLDKFF